MNIKKIIFLFTALTVISFAPACSSGAPAPQEGAMTLSISSAAFKDGSRIPARFTGDGADISPPLVWGEPPQQTQSFALIVDDPNAPGGVFTHWVLFDLPPDTRQLDEGIPSQQQLRSGAQQGRNDFGKIGYGGPFPPHGPAHHYRFTLYALDASLGLKSGASKSQVLAAMKGHILAQGLLIGTYQR